MLKNESFQNILALPLGELSPKVTERAQGSVFRDLRILSGLPAQATSPKGRGKRKFRQAKDPFVWMALVFPERDPTASSNSPSDCCIYLFEPLSLL